MSGDHNAYQGDQGGIDVVELNQTKYTYHPHISHPGYGWIEPLMDADCPLLEEELAKNIVVQLQWDEEVMRSALEALEGVAEWVDQPTKTHPWDAWKKLEPTINALKERLA